MGFSALGDFAAGAIGPMIAGGLNYYGSRQANRANREMAREQMGFQERMSSTAYQRAVHDMEAAGINPILAYQQGGASSPGGASIQQQNEIGPAVNSALDARQKAAEVQNMKSVNRNLEEQNRKIRAETELTKIMADSQRSTAKALAYQLPGMANKANIDSSSLGQSLDWIERVSHVLTPFINAFNPFKK